MKQSSFIKIEEKKERKSSTSFEDSDSDSSMEQFSFIKIEEKKERKSSIVYDEDDDCLIIEPP